MIMHNRFTTYKVDSKGKMRIKEFFAEGDTLIQRSGILGGKIIENPRKCTAKNVGRANFTSAEEQAVLQAQRKYDDLLTRDYYATPEEAREAKESGSLVMPMLAQDFFKRESKLDKTNGAFLQQKLDGMRCLAFVSGDANGINVSLMSRSNRPIENMMHIEEELKDMCKTKSMPFNIIFDGELYVHGENFQTNMSYVKKYYPGKSERIGYFIYDVVMDSGFKVRNDFLANTVQKRGPEYKVQGLAPVFVNDFAEIPKYYQQFIDDGFEGLMVRMNDDVGYQQNKRSNTLLKYKKFIDDVGIIVDVIASDRVPTHGRPVIEMNGKRFRAGTKLTHAQREELLTNKDDYIGKTAEIRFFEYSEDGIPRFPVYHGIRLDK